MQIVATYRATTIPATATTADMNTASRSTAWDGRKERRQQPETEDRRSRPCRRAADTVNRRMVYGLEQLVWDGTPVPPPARILAAARVFSEGNHFFTGQIVDRSA